MSRSNYFSKLKPVVVKTDRYTFFREELKNMNKFKYLVNIYCVFSLLAGLIFNAIADILVIERTDLGQLGWQRHSHLSVIMPTVCTNRSVG